MRPLHSCSSPHAQLASGLSSRPKLVGRAGQAWALQHSRLKLACGAMTRLRLLLDQHAANGKTTPRTQSLTHHFQHRMFQVAQAPQLHLHPLVSDQNLPGLGTRHRLQCRAAEVATGITSSELESGSRSMGERGRLPAGMRCNL